MIANAAELPPPPLREDLRLLESAPDSNGEPAWVIQDTVVNRFYRIGWLEFECLLRWEHSPEDICRAIHAETPLRPDVEQIVEFRQFLENHQLLRPGREALARLAARSQDNAWLSWRWWLHHYLFSVCRCCVRNSIYSGWRTSSTGCSSP